MKNNKTEDKPRKKEQVESNNVEEDLDRFIEKREIQNEALKKIVGMNINKEKNTNK
jgi:hypothetical protein